MSGHAAAGLELLDVLGHAERERMGAVAVARHEEPIPRSGGLERGRQQHRRKRRAGVAEASEERVLELEVRHLMELHDALEALGEKAVAQVHDDFVIYPVWAAKH